MKKGLLICSSLLIILNIHCNAQDKNKNILSVTNKDNLEAQLKLIQNSFRFKPFVSDELKVEADYYHLPFHRDIIKSIDFYEAIDHQGKNVINIERTKEEKVYGVNVSPPSVHLKTGADINNIKLIKGIMSVSYPLKHTYLSFNLSEKGITKTYNNFKFTLQDINGDKAVIKHNVPNILIKLIGLNKNKEILHSSVEGSEEFLTFIETSEKLNEVKVDIWEDITDKQIEITALPL